MKESLPCLLTVLLPPDMKEVSPHQAILLHQLDLLWSDSVLAEMLGDSIRSHRFRILHPSSGASHKLYIPRIHNFCATQLQSRGSDDPLAWIICYNSTQNLGKSLIIFTSLLKNTVKDTDEPPDAETHRAGSGRVLSVGVSVPWNWAMTPSW